MRSITVRRISQAFFFMVFVWFCVVASLGQNWWQLQGWPINWMLQLDPLIGLGVLLATHTVYAGLLWGVITIVLTLFLGRFFCGWVCPFGALQHLAGYLGLRGQKRTIRIQRNQPHKARKIKYWLLLFLLAAASGDFLHFLVVAPLQKSYIFWSFAGIVTFAVLLLIISKAMVLSHRLILVIGTIWAFGIVLEFVFPNTHWLSTSLQTGLLDPLALMHRSFNLVVLPLADQWGRMTAPQARFYSGSAAIGLLFLCLMIISFRIPRFYCRFLCPLGALFGLLGRGAIWRMGKTANHCRECRMCESDCQGACTPSRTIRASECVLCLNCMDSCNHNVMTYQAGASISGETTAPDMQRREVVAVLAAGLVVVPMVRLGSSARSNINPDLIRPPGALGETAFLARCIKCGQCMRICPTNVIQPIGLQAGLQTGLEGLWTPKLNFRLGSSGCRMNCVACSRVCPTAAIRPLSLDERLGRNQYAGQGPIRIGTAFVNRGRCLPWAMDRPCIVCQENCPVSPKAIFTRTVLQVVHNGRLRVNRADSQTLTFASEDLASRQWATGDYFCRWQNHEPRPITGSTADAIVLGPDPAWSRQPAAGEIVEIMVRLQQPYVDPRYCIGCGVCEHECPVYSHRAIQVTAENESRNLNQKLIL